MHQCTWEDDRVAYSTLLVVSVFSSSFFHISVGWQLTSRRGRKVTAELWMEMFLVDSHSNTACFFSICCQLHGSLSLQPRAKSCFKDDSSSRWVTGAGVRTWPTEYEEEGGADNTLPTSRHKVTSGSRVLPWSFKSFLLRGPRGRSLYSTNHLFTHRVRLVRSPLLIRLFSSKWTSFTERLCLEELVAQNQLLLCNDGKITKLSDPFKTPRALCTYLWPLPGCS